MENYRKVIPRENLIMLLMAASILLFNFVGIIVCYFVWNEYRQESDFVAENGKNLLNFHFSYILYEFISSILLILIVGAVLMPVVAIAYFVFNIIGMVKFGKHLNYKYPLTINFIK